MTNDDTTVRLPAPELTLGQWHQVFETNLTGAILFAKEVYPSLKARGIGKMFNVGSMLWLLGSAELRLLMVGGIDVLLASEASTFMTGAAFQPTSVVLQRCARTEVVSDQDLCHG